MIATYKPTDGDPNFVRVSIFLAGSIEMGTAEDWQTTLTDSFKDLNLEDVAFFNPRRDDWDSTWEQDQTNPQFNYQVNWELTHLMKSDIIFMYFSPLTKSPISLLELGLFANSKKMIVCCPKSFWRKGNVDIVCTRFGIPLFNDYREAVGALRTLIETKYYTHG